MEHSAYFLALVRKIGDIIRACEAEIGGESRLRFQLAIGT